MKFVFKENLLPTHLKEVQTACTHPLKPFGQHPNQIVRDFLVSTVISAHFKMSRKLNHMELLIAKGY
jgi:hypothetical protein